MVAKKLLDAAVGIGHTSCVFGAGDFGLLRSEQMFGFDMRE